MRTLIGFVVVGALAIAPSTAHAGRTPYGWLYGTEVLPERAVELQTWILERDNLEHENHAKVTSWWVGPLVGVTDQLELAFPIETRWLVDDTRTPSFTMERFGAEARYRFVSSDPVEAPAFVPLGRIAVKRDVTARDATVIEADLVGAYTVGRFQASVDVGFYTSLSKAKGNDVELRPGVGISIETVEDLRLGVEAFGEQPLGSDDKPWYAAGPNLAWTHGRFWLSASYGIGITGITAAPRFMWGVLF